MKCKRQLWVDLSPADKILPGTNDSERLLWLMWPAMNESRTQACCVQAWSFAREQPCISRCRVLQKSSSLYCLYRFTCNDFLLLNAVYCPDKRYTFSRSRLLLVLGLSNSQQMSPWKPSDCRAVLASTQQIMFALTVNDCSNVNSC